MSCSSEDELLKTPEAVSGVRDSELNVVLFGDQGVGKRTWLDTLAKAAISSYSYQIAHDVSVRVFKVRGFLLRWTAAANNCLVSITQLDNYVFTFFLFSSKSWNHTDENQLFRYSLLHISNLHSTSNSRSIKSFMAWWS